MNTETDGEKAQPASRVRRIFLTRPTPAGTLGEVAHHPSYAFTAAR